MRHVDQADTQEPFEIIGQRRGEVQLIAMFIGKCDRLSVQEKAWQTERPGFGICVRVSVALVAGNGKSLAEQMNPDLMGAASQR